MPRRPPVEVWCELVCAQCSQSGPGMFTTSTVSRSLLVAAAESKRWIIAAGRAFCCKACQTEYAEEAARRVQEP